MDFETYWENHGIKCEVGALENAFREVAEKAWDAAKEEPKINTMFVNFCHIAYKADPGAKRYQQLASSQLPIWAADVKPGRLL